MEKERDKRTVCVVSKCLLGEPCRFDGKSKKVALPPWDGMEVIALCPELEAGLTVPRPPCEICGGDGTDVLYGRAKILDKFGADKTDAYISGARICAEICKRNGVTRAYLKSKSPECGSGRIYDGTHSRRLILGDGVFAALLKQMGVEVIETEAE